MRDAHYSCNMTIEILHLAPNQPLALRGAHGLTLACLIGELWITLDGDALDYIVPRGYKFNCCRNGSLVVNSLKVDSVAMLYQVDAGIVPAFNTSFVCEDLDGQQNLIKHAIVQRNMAIPSAVSWMARSITGVWRLVGRVLVPYRRQNK